MRTIRKLSKTLKICYTMLMAQAFGSYVNSGWNGQVEYAHYRWNDMDVFIPTYFEML